MAKKTEQRQGRGELTQRIKDKSRELLGREISQLELRLYPYLMHAMMNEQKLDPRKINGEERKILSRLREDGHIEGGAGGMQMTEEFWNIMVAIVFLGYVDID